MKAEILVNATPPETRVAVLEDGRPVEVFHERRNRRGLVGNVYLGRVHRVLPGIQAAFVSIGLERDAFLYVEDALPRPIDLVADQPSETEGEDSRPAAREAPPARIDEIVQEGQAIVVQVTKDPLPGKGPRVTANLALPGRTIVYLPGLREAAVSRRIGDERERERLAGILAALPAEGGFIARTAAQGCAPQEFQADWRHLTELSARITQKAQQGSPPLVLHSELDLALRVVRDLTTSDVCAIRVDDETTHARIADFLSAVAPAWLSRLQLEREPPPLFERYGVEEAIQSALQSRVALPSGATLVIHQTEALVAIDVNSGKFVGREALEETVFETNLEAIPEIARQIRLRDLGGLIVVDFIDMERPAHRREVSERFEAELSRDRARTRTLPISDFGLIEITRQRSRGNLERTLTRPCPDCSGTGRVKTDLSVALDIRRALAKVLPLYASGETVSVRVRPSLLRTLREEEPDPYADLLDGSGVKIELVEDSSLRSEEFEILKP